MTYSYKEKFRVIERLLSYIHKNVYKDDITKDYNKMENKYVIAGY